jgi:hypothetical protein
MNPSLFTKIIGQLPNETIVVPFFRGESLLHPHFAMFMRQLSRFKQVQLATNGDYLEPKNQTAILTSCTFLSVSLHSFTMPWQLESAKFLRIAGKRGLETQVSILEGLVPEKRKKQFIREWQKHVDRVRLYREHSIRGFGDMEGVEKPHGACKKPFEEMTVYWDGKIGLCNHDWNNLTELGDLNGCGVEEVWRGCNYLAVRKLHESGKRNAVNSCVDCCFVNEMYGELYVANSQ